MEGKDKKNLDHASVSNEHYVNTMFWELREVK